MIYSRRYKKQPTPEIKDEKDERRPEAESEPRATKKRKRVDKKTVEPSSDS